MCGIALVLQAAAGQASPEADEAWRAALRAAVHPRGPDAQGEQEVIVADTWRLWALGAVLHMRGPAPWPQPAQDAEGNLLLWNGEVFGGGFGCCGGSDHAAAAVPTPGPGDSDTAAVLEALRLAAAAAGAAGAEAEVKDAVSQGIRDALAGVEGPWAMVYYHRASRTLHYGRDRLGRRSLVMLWAGGKEERGRGLTLASTAAAAAVAGHGEGEGGGEWEEVRVEGLWRLDLSSPELAPRLIPWPAAPPSPSPSPSPAAPSPSSLAAAAEQLLAALDASVRRRVAEAPAPLPPLVTGEGEGEVEGMSPLVTGEGEGEVEGMSPLVTGEGGGETEAAASVGGDGGAARVAVLYSGGLDCQVLAALAHRHLPPSEPIDLVNVCFDEAAGHRSPDRLAALTGVGELRRACPGRAWRLVLVDVGYARVKGAERWVKRLIQPCASPMDFNIASSFFFAARAEGRLADDSDVAQGLAAAASGACRGLLRYGDASSSSSSSSSAAAGLVLRHEMLPPAPRPCPREGCRRVAKPGCKGAMCGNCCAKEQRRRLEAILAAFDDQQQQRRRRVPEGAAVPAAAAAAADVVAAAGTAGGPVTDADRAAVAAVLCQAHKVAKKWLPPALRPPKQQRQQQHHHHHHQQQQQHHHHHHQQQQQQERPSPPVHTQQEEEEETAAASAAAAAAAPPSPQQGEEEAKPVVATYRSRARVVLLGIGADEQLAGYGRHRSTFSAGGRPALARELAMDLGRLWTRNLGRDDRCIAEHGREARFPYLDERVMALLAGLPMELKFDLREPRGVGDKKVLRHVAGQLLGLPGAASLVKRAIQFGSRIAREANTHTFGSHRAGKQTRCWPPSAAAAAAAAADRGDTSQGEGGDE